MRGRSARNVDRVSVLKIDKDSFVNRHWIRDYLRLVLNTCHEYRVKVVAVKKTLSERKGVHFYVEIDPPVEAELANRLQWLLGDDSRRVDFNRARIESGLNEWNKLFEVVGRRLRMVYPKLARAGAPTREKGSWRGCRRQR
jgi:hypothetical protein